MELFSLSFSIAELAQLSRVIDKDFLFEHTRESQKTPKATLQVSYDNDENG